MTKKVAVNYDKTIPWTVRAWARGQKVSFELIFRISYENHLQL